MDLKEVTKDTTPPIKQRNDSWVEVAKKKQVLKKYDFKISESEGKKSVDVPSDIIEKANPLWGDFVIARFLETAPHIAKVHMIVNKIWAFGETNQKVEVYEIDATTMRIRITNEKIRNKIVRRGMWNIAGVPMVVSHWTPEEDKSKAGLVPLWVHVTNVPMNMYSWEGLSFITSAAGIPDHLHPETIACTNFDIAKVFVLADLTKELPLKINYNIQGKETIVQFSYPWLPPKCDKCRRWGHYETFCKENKLEVATVKDSVVTQAKENVEVVLNTVNEVTTSNREVEEGVIKNAGTIVGEYSKTKDGSKVKKGKESEVVSNEKIGRSPKTQNLQYGQVKIITPSRYAALSNMEENGAGELVTEDEKEDMEIEEADDAFQSKAEESIEGKTKEIRKGRARKNLPRQSKTNHRIVSERGTSKNH
ncbi:hypothetical protein Bca101_008524 [Brassica carinata]